MRVYRNQGAAQESMNKKDPYYLNSFCPYQTGNKLCGSWCALFHLENGGETTSPFVILGCKAGEKFLYVEEIIGD